MPTANSTRLLTWVTSSNVSLNTTTKINCQSLYVFNQLMGNTAIFTSSTLLMMRTIAIWSRNLYIVVPLVILSLGRKSFSLFPSSMEQLSDIPCHS